MCPLLFLEKGCTGDKNVEALCDKQNNDPKDAHILIPVGCSPDLLRGASQGDQGSRDGRFPWLIGVGPVSSHGFSHEGGGRARVRALKMRCCWP